MEVHPAAFDWDRAMLAGRRNMPHLRQENAVYFITMRLGDSLPSDVVYAWKEELERAALDNEERRLALLRRMERYLDRPQGACVLSDYRAADILKQAIRDRDGEKYLLDEFCVMPNHVHVLVMPLATESLTAIVGNWQKYSAREINKVLGRRGSLWEGEPMDHIVRDTQALHRFRAYVRANPAKVPGKHTVCGRGLFPEVTGI